MSMKIFTARYASIWGLLFSCWTLGMGQAPSVQDCIGAIPVCQKIYTEDNTYRGNGNILDFEAGLICMDVEQNSVWYTFQVDQTGQFGFLITPRDLNDDYDWALFNLTNATCDDLYNNPAAYVVSCNAAGGDDCHGLTGATGDTQYNIQGANCGLFPPNVSQGLTALNDYIEVEAGNVYALCVNNWNINRGGSGYTIDFGHSTDIGIFDETPPEVVEMDLVNECSGDEIGVRFSERIQCATISADNFALDGPDGNIPLTLFSQECENGYQYSDFFILRSEIPIESSGSYTLTVDLNGTTEALDLCDNPALPNEFVIPNPIDPQVVDLGRDVTMCSGESYTIEAGDGFSDYSWSTGSTASSISVDESGTYSVTVTTECGEVTDEILVNFNDGPPSINLGADRLLCPMDTFTLDVTTPGATYLWQDGSNQPVYVVTLTGTYAVTVTTGCGESSDRITYNYGEPNLLLDLGEDQKICASDEGITLNAMITQDDYAAYLWNDGLTEASRSVTTPGTYSVTVTTDYAIVSDEIIIDVEEEGDNDIDLGEDLAICPDETITLDATTSGAIYLWQDGSNNPTFSVAEPGIYQVTVTTDCSVSSDTIEVTALAPPSLELGNDTTICVGGSVMLDAGIDAAGATYLWQDGSQGTTLNVTEPGVYSVTVTDICGERTDDILVDYTPDLMVDMWEDTVVCQGEALALSVVGNANRFLWSDGSTDTVLVVDQPGSYSVTAGNGCEETTLMIDVGECVTCKFYVPNAISPNGDGNNDVFMPYSSFECPIQDYQLQVYDRWGALVHETTSLEKGWEGFVMTGEEADAGTYVYQINLNVLENGQLKPVSLSGGVTLLR